MRFSHCVRQGLLVLGIAVSAAGGAGAQETAAKPTTPGTSDKPAAKQTIEPAVLAGSWGYVSGSRGGVAADENNLSSTVVINDKEFRLGGLPDGSEFVMAYKLLPDQSPQRIEFEISSGPGAGSKATGIVQMDGDELVLCYDPSEGQFPRTFESTSDNGYHLFRLKRKKTAFDPAQLVGRWKYRSGTRGGEKIEASRLEGEFTVTAENFELPAGPSDKFVMKYQLDAAKEPVAIDLEIVSGPVPSGKAVGILKMNGAEWTLCYDPLGNKRPEKFESTAENGYFLFEIERAGDAPAAPAAAGR